MCGWCVCVCVCIIVWNHTVKSNHLKIYWNLMAAELYLYSLYFLLLVIDFSDQYKTIHCKSTSKSSVCNKRYHILTIFHWNISIYLLINSQKLFTMYRKLLYRNWKSIWSVHISLIKALEFICKFYDIFTL